MQLFFLFFFVCFVVSQLGTDSRELMLLFLLCAFFCFVLSPSSSSVQRNLQMLPSNILKVLLFAMDSIKISTVSNWNSQHSESTTSMKLKELMIQLRTIPHTLLVSAIMKLKLKYPKTKSIQTKLVILNMNILFARTTRQRITWDRQLVVRSHS